jgi:1-aminocyclopropane-1-carboxylate synthase
VKSSTQDSHPYPLISSERMLSKRASHIPPLPHYIFKQLAISGNRYCQDTNPDGAILMSICENKLCGDIILDKINTITQFSSDIMNYTDPTGLPEFKAVLSRFLARNIFTNCDIQSQNVVVSAGCTALIYQMSICLFDPGDSVLIPTPWYAAFEMDFAAVGDVATVRVYTDPPVFALSIENMNKAYDEAVTSGHPPKAFLLTNPSNPLGTVCSAQEIMDVVSWCRERGLHCIMDEIYALSMPADSTEQATSTSAQIPQAPTASVSQKFVSAASVLGNDLRDDVHILWGFSKDMAASGLRVGALYTHNTALVRAMSALIGFQVSNITQEIGARLLDDDSFIDFYFSECRKRQAMSREMVVSTLLELGMIIVPGQCTLFLFANFQNLLPEITFEAERVLFDQLVDDCKLCFTPGEACGCSTPGYFRICFAWESYSSVCEAMRRLKAFCTVKRTAISDC